MGGMIGTIGTLDFMGGKDLSPTAINIIIQCLIAVQISGCTQSP